MRAKLLELRRMALLARITGRRVLVFTMPAYVAHRRMLVLRASLERADSERLIAELINQTVSEMVRQVEPEPMKVH